jgi:hypothetical protein
MGVERMKPFSLRCEDAFHEQFKGISFPDDAAIHIWREAWAAALDVAIELLKEETVIDLAKKKS